MRCLAGRVNRAGALSERQSPFSAEGEPAFPGDVILLTGASGSS
jgi:hypothetical protein